MRRRFAAGLAIALTAISVLAAGGAWAALIRSYAAPDGDGRLIGLDASARVARDTNGVPHIYAETAHDLFYLQGYVTASDRLWQLEFLRRLGQARLSELFGGATLEADRFVRTLGWYRVARREVAALTAETRALLEAYAAGVNKYVETHHESPPIEFLILGVAWEPWQPADSVVIGKVMAWDLSGNWETELLRANVAARLGESALGVLFPEAPLSTPAIFSLVDGAVARVPGAEQLRTLLQSEAFGELGSNNWVVSGARTTTGKPLLANDPHLGTRNPSIWYLAHLSGAGYEVAGFSIPGTVGITIGHNARIAWGVTNLAADVQDLYVEQLDPADPRGYRFGARIERATVLREEIVVKGQPSVVLDVVETRHGPIITPVTQNVKQTLAFRWTALDPGTLFTALLKLNRATNWTEFRDALRDWDVPGQNFVYADVDGHIGYQATGKWPIRAAGDGRMPVPGWDGAHEWTGYVPFDAMPSRFDPPGGMILTANQRILGTWPDAVPGEFDPGFRAQRIRDLLLAGTRLGPADFARIQSDVVDLSTDRFLSVLRALPAKSERATRAQALLRVWDGAMRADLAEPAIYWSWQLKMLERTFKDKLGADLYAQYLGYSARGALYEMVRLPDHPWFVVLANPIHHGRDELAALALEDALDELTARLGADVSAWRWGRLHTITFEHPLGAILPQVFNIGPFPNDGALFTVNNGPFSLKKPYAQTGHPSMRMIVDLADFDAMAVIYPTGQAGQPFARHWGDLTSAYFAGRHVTLPFTRGKLGKLEGTLRFTPR